MRRRAFDPGRLALFVITAVISVLMALPLVWMLLCSLRTDAEILSAPFGVPEKWRWEQWRVAWTEGNLGVYAVNSVGITGLTLLGTLGFGAAAGYGLARSDRGARGLLIYLPGLVIPSQAAAVPTFLLLRTLGLLDTWWALVLPYTAWSLPLAVYVFFGFFSSQAVDPEEAARLDGCSILQLFWRVALPIARPAAGVVAVITALGTWNEFLFALLFVHSDHAKTLPLALQAFSTAHTTDYGITFAALAIMSLPLLIGYAFVQRTVIEGSSALIH